MNLIIVSGLSGSGKSIALHLLEDMDYYCVDNLPISMLPALIKEFHKANSQARQNIAIGIDARNIPDSLNEFESCLDELKENKINYKVFYLEANDETIIKRFSETRRKHPLSQTNMSLSEAIILERKLLEPIAYCADLRFDTSLTNVHQLRERIKERLVKNNETSTSVLIESFGFKHGAPVNADFVFDVRCLSNPHWMPELRPKTGKDKAVIDFLESSDDVKSMYHDILQFLEKWIPKFIAENRSYMTIAIGCTGGQHRSVYLTEKISSALKKHYPNILVRHRELE